MDSTTVVARCKSQTGFNRLLLTGKVSGVGEQDGPFVLFPLVKALDAPLGRVRRKVGYNVSQSEIAVSRTLGV